MLVVVCVRYAYLSKYRNNNYQINININRIFRGHVEFVFTINFLSSTYIDGTFLLIFFKCRRNYIYYNTVGTDQHISHESRRAPSRAASVILFTLGGNPRIPDVRGAARVKVSSEAYSCVKRLKDKWREDIVFDYNSNFSNFKWEKKIKTINTISLSRNRKGQLFKRACNNAIRVDTRSRKRTKLRSETNINSRLKGRKEGRKRGRGNRH